jgi:hypothetical protein
MDTSEIYIKMCLKAKDLQISHAAYDVGDFYFEGRDARSQRPKFILAPAELAGKERNIGNLTTWLPRQDQLQEKLGDFSHQCEIMREYLLKEALMEAFTSSSKGKLTTMEQIWLTLVIKEKYGKVWNGEDWVKPNNGSNGTNGTNGTNGKPV